MKEELLEEMRLYYELQYVQCPERETDRGERRESKGEGYAYAMDVVFNFFKRDAK